MNKSHGSEYYQLPRSAILPRLSMASIARHSVADRTHKASASHGILHLGCGAFHRAHQAVFTQRAIAEAGNRSPRWGICGVSFRSEAVRNILAPQDYLYTVLERGPGRIKAEVISVVQNVLSASKNRAELIATFARPETKIVSLTVTPSGYLSCCPPIEFHEDHEPSGRPHTDRSAGVASLIVEGLATIRDQGTCPPVLLSCDNMPRNGAYLRGAVLERAALINYSLVDWIKGNVQFPCSVVDRIVPSPTLQDSVDAARLLGLQDAAALSTEPYKQWVIESFEGERPRWELAGAEFVSDTTLWETSKLRLLNGTHLAIAYLGILAGVNTVSSFVSNPLFARYISRLMLQELLPTVPKSDHDLTAYSRQLLTRWLNREIAHQLVRIARNGSDKMHPRLLEPLLSNIVAGRPSPCATLAVAAWICWAGRLMQFEGDVEDRSRIRELVKQAGEKSSRVVSSLLKERSMFSADFVLCPQFEADLSAAVDSLRSRGAHGAISAMMGSSLS